MRAWYFISLFFLCFNSFAQLSISNGVSVPTKGTLYTLVVYAEIDFSKGTCPQNLADNLNGQWPKDSNGVTQIPNNADYFFDHEITRSPKGAITKYYHTASFGAYEMLGDYFPYVISLPCSEVKMGSSGIAEITKKINELYENEILTSANGIPLEKFDQWTPTPPGQAKLNQPDGKIDLLYIVWRNNRFIVNQNTIDYSGYGVHPNDSGNFLSFKGVNNLSSFNCTIINKSAEMITIAEHLHGIFGGNHWHSSGGRGNHTFMNQPATWGVTGQFHAATQTPCAWDRDMMNWKNPEKSMLISALDENQKEINGDIKLNDSIASQTFILRDFITSGDALRIHLPHILWQKEGDVKNQYLWLENHQMRHELDQWCETECNNTNHGKYPKGTPGIYAYIQVGKDQKEGNNEIYSSDTKSRNGLAGWMYPLSAEGNYDFKIAEDSTQKGQWIECNWNNANIPVDKKNSITNSFTGLNDLTIIFDSNHDSIIQPNEIPKCTLSEIENGKVVHYYQHNGDWKDAFCKATGNTEISISTNPSPITIYTYTSNYEYNQNFQKNGVFPSYENRTIHLNGLQIKILEELSDGGIKAQVIWNNYNVDKDVRWCGNIELHENDFDVKKPSLIVNKKVNITLSKASTPVLHTPAHNNEKYIGWTEKTILTSNKGIIEMKPFSKIIIEENCSLILDQNSKLRMGLGAKIIIKKGGEFIYGNKKSILKKIGAKIKEEK